MKARLKIITGFVAVSTLGSLMGWYWHGLVDCLGMDVHTVHFGPALLWIVVALLASRVINRLVFND